MIQTSEGIVRWLESVIDFKLTDRVRNQLIINIRAKCVDEVGSALKEASYKHSQIRKNANHFKELHGYDTLDNKVEIECGIIINSYPLSNIK